MASQSPLKVAFQDDDFYALQECIALLMRDPRTTVVGEAETPEQLLAWLGKAEPWERPDVVAVDLECPAAPDPGELIARVRMLAPEVTVVCLMQYGAPALVQAAAAAGAQGIVLKRDVGLAIATALLRARRGPFVYSAGVAPALRGVHEHLLVTGRLLPSWAPPDELSPQLERSLRMCLIYGVPARWVAQKLGLKHETVQRYVMWAYGALHRPLDESSPDIEELEWPAVGAMRRKEPRSDDLAFLQFTAPPEEGRAR